MNGLQKRVVKLEEAANPTPEPEEALRAEKLREAIKEGRERVLAFDSTRKFLELNDSPLPGVLFLPNGKVDLAAAINAGREWAAADAIQSQQ